MEQQQDLENKNKTAKHMEMLGEIIDDMPKTILACLIAPMMLKEIKESHPEVYYGLKIKLKNMQEGLTQFTPKLAKSIKEMQ